MNYACLYFVHVQYILFLQIIVDAVLAIQRPDTAIDLHMVEIMEMKHKTELDTQWVALSTEALVETRNRPDQR